MVLVNDSVELSASLGEQMHSLATRLFPICRSITGNGVRSTLEILKEEIPLHVHEIPTGTKVFDWEIPREWNIKDAYIKNSKGQKIVDFKNSNLHVLNYSIPVHKTISLEELKKHLYYITEYPDWIPYRTSYYKENWGFCITYNQFLELEEDFYEVCIDSTLEKGHLTYGECFIQGETTNEVLISTHVCHPSLANDNLSGIAVVVELVKHFLQFKPRFSYRFIFIPGTIGAITWLACNESVVPKIKYGLVASLLGDQGPFTYKKSRRGNTEIDVVAEHVIKARDARNKVIDFFPYGYDERQYCSPGFDLAVGCLTRTPFGQYVQYHTSADNLDIISPITLEESFNTYLEIMLVMENNKTFVNTNPKCEPHLGKYGLYGAEGGKNNEKEFQMALLWILSLSDGQNSLLSISKRSNMRFELISQAAAQLEACGLLTELAKGTD